MEVSETAVNDDVRPLHVRHTSKVRIKDLRRRVSIALRNEADVLLAHVLGKDRLWLLAHEQDPVPAPHIDRALECLQRLERGEPVQYITETAEFYGRVFSVSPSVLIPRPATENLVRMALDTLDGKSLAPVTLERDIAGVPLLLSIDVANVNCVVDIGTGSGCIAVTLALQRPDLRVIATDVSAAALTVAKHNAEKLGATNVDFREGSLLEPVADEREPFLIVSNPPYIPAGRQLDESVARHEPALALYGDADGLSVLRKLVCEAAAHPFCKGLLVECGSEQQDELMRLADACDRGTTGA